MEQQAAQAQYVPHSTMSMGAASCQTTAAVSKTASSQYEPGAEGTDDIAKADSGCQVNDMESDNSNEAISTKPQGKALLGCDAAPTLSAISQRPEEGPRFKQAAWDAATIAAASALQQVVSQVSEAGSSELEFVDARQWPQTPGSAATSARSSLLPSPISEKPAVETPAVSLADTRQSQAAVVLTTTGAQSSTELTPAFENSAVEALVVSALATAAAQPDLRPLPVSEWLREVETTDVRVSDAGHSQSASALAGETAALQAKEEVTTLQADEAAPKSQQIELDTTQACPSNLVQLQIRNESNSVAAEAIPYASGGLEAGATASSVRPRGIWRHAALYGTVTATLSLLALPVVPPLLAQHPSHDPLPFFIVGFICLIIGIALTMSMIFAFPAITRGEYLDQPLKLAVPTRWRGLGRAVWIRQEQGVAKTMALFVWAATSLHIAGLMFAVAGIYTPDLMAPLHHP